MCDKIINNGKASEQGRVMIGGQIGGIRFKGSRSGLIIATLNDS